MSLSEAPAHERFPDPPENMCSICYGHHPPASEHPLRPAPDGQPTSNIQTMLRQAQQDLQGWEQDVVRLEHRLAAARRMVAHQQHQVRLHTYQLRLRQETNASPQP